MTSKVFTILQTPEARAQILSTVLEDYLRVGFEAKTPADATMSGFMVAVSRAIVTVAASVYANSTSRATVDDITDDLLDFVEEFTYEALAQFKALPPSAVQVHHVSGATVSQEADHDS